MLKPRTNLFRNIYALSDVLIIFVSYYLSEWLWIDIISDSRNILQQPEMRGYVFGMVLAYAVVIAIVFAAIDVYRSFRYQSVLRIWLKCSLVHAIMIGLIIVSLYIFRVQDVSRGALLLFFVSTSLLLLIKHIVAIGLLRRIRQTGYNQKHVILVGSGQLASDYASAVTTNAKYGITIDGYLSESDCLSSCKYMGTIDDLKPLISGHGVDEVIIALDRPDPQRVSTVIECCENCGTRVCVIPFYNNMISETPSVHIIGKVKCFELRTSPLDDMLNRFFKRTFDILFSLFAIIITSPIMLFVAIGVKLSSPGPILFRQTRVGKGKRIFTMYKFRSMKVNDGSTTMWTKNRDPRKTRFGSFIRKFSLDELPQFFNVLTGDMSVIGPRPEIPHYVDEFRETIPRYMLKHLVRPGITGWAQVNGYRGDTSIEERIKCDIWYIENWSVGLDFKILLRTVFGGMANSEKLVTKKDQSN